MLFNCLLLFLFHTLFLLYFSFGSLIEMRVHAVHAYQKSYTITHPVNRISRNSNSYKTFVSPNWFAFACQACQTHLELVVYGDFFTFVPWVKNHHVNHHLKEKVITKVSAASKSVVSESTEILVFALSIQEVRRVDRKPRRGRFE